MRQTKKIALLGLMLAIITVLSALEHMLPPLPLLPPNVKLGLSNVVTMYCVFFVSKSSAVTLNAAKSFFVFLMRGPMAALLSFCGGMLSVAVVILLVVIFRERVSYVAVSVCGAVAHNIGQFAAVSVLLASPYIIYYLPILLVAGAALGTVTGMLLKVVMPVFNRVFKP